MLKISTKRLKSFQKGLKEKKVLIGGKFSIECFTKLLGISNSNIYVDWVKLYSDGSIYIGIGGKDIPDTYIQLKSFVQDQTYFYHTLSETPFLGFKGCLFFIQRMLDALSLFMHKERRVVDTSTSEENKR